MDCRRIRELLITQYIDGQANKELYAEIRAHISSCTECNKFLCDLGEAAVSPFKGLKREAVPEAVWQNVKASIEAERAGFRFVLRMPRPALTAAAVIAIAAVLLAGRFAFVARYRLNAYLKDQMEFLSYLEGDNENDYFGSGSGLGTGIEEYFL